MKAILDDVNLLLFIKILMSSHDVILHAVNNEYHIKAEKNANLFLFNILEAIH